MDKKAAARKTKKADIPASGKGVARSLSAGKARAADPACFYEPNADSLCEENNAGHLIKNVYISLSRMIDQGVAPLGLTAMQWRPLVILRYTDVDTSAELSRKGNVDTGAMTRTLDRLEAKGFITRHRSEKDRRIVKLTLTSSGRQAADATLPVVAQSLNSHLKDFSAHELKTLLNLLQRMIANGLDPQDTSTPCL